MLPSFGSRSQVGYEKLTEYQRGAVDALNALRLPETWQALVRGMLIVGASPRVAIAAGDGFETFVLEQLELFATEALGVSDPKVAFDVPPADAGFIAEHTSEPIEVEGWRRENERLCDVWFAKKGGV